MCNNDKKKSHDVIKIQNICFALSFSGGGHDLVYLPQMCNRNTQAMNRRLITKTGTGPLDRSIAINNVDM